MAICAQNWTFPRTMHATEQNQHSPQQQQHHKNQEQVWGEVWTISQNPRVRLFAESIPATPKEWCAVRALAFRETSKENRAAHWAMNPGTPQKLPPGELQPRWKHYMSLQHSGSPEEPLLESIYTPWEPLIDLSPCRQSSWKQGVQTRALEPVWPSQPSPCGSPPSKDLSPLPMQGSSYQRTAPGPSITIISPAQ